MMAMDTPDSAFEIRKAIFDIADREQFLTALRKIATKTGTSIVCFNADILAGQRHAEFAIRHALRSCKEGAPIANSLEMEALLYASGNRQCSVASSFGVHIGKNRGYICCCPPHDGIWDALAQLVRYVDEDWDMIDWERRSRLKKLFSISEEEIAAVGESRFFDLVLERVALLEVYR
jgi:KEOPS complex subunit Cgi121